MGAFISMSGIIGKNLCEVLETLNSYFGILNKELEETALASEIYNLFLLDEYKNNTVLIYPETFFEFEEIAMYLSKELKIPIFNFYIYDTDLWVYEMYYDGKIIDKFNPSPKYLNNIDENRLELYKGNPEIVCEYVKNIEFKDIKEYYRPWTEELISNKKKAYSDDEFYYGSNWQAVDYMKKLNLKYPITDEEETIGRAFKLI